MEIDFLYLVRPFTSNAFFNYSVSQDYKDKARYYVKKKYLKGMRAGSVIESTYDSCRGSKFISQHPPDNSQSSVIPVPEDVIPSSGLHRY